MMNNQHNADEWITIAEALAQWRTAPHYDMVYRLVKQSKIETRKRGKYLTFRLADLQTKLSWQDDMRQLAQAVQGDWYTRSRDQ